MKYLPDDRMPVLELTRRNLTTLLTKLDDPHSARTLIDGDNRIAVRAVEDAAHYTDRPPGYVVPSPVAGPPQTAPQAVCPECAAGKCRNCTGTALDPATDEFVSCTCTHQGEPA